MKTKPPGKKRERDRGDLDYRVWLEDKEGMVIRFPGTFWGSSMNDAIDRALREYPGVMANMETRQWNVYAELAPREEILQSTHG